MDISPKSLIVISGIAGFTGVALGAFGAHGLKGSLSPEMLDTFRTGVTYHLIHTAAIASIAIVERKRFYTSALLFVLGIILFSCSLYLYSITGVGWLAIVTPIGGLSFLAGWGMMIYSALRNPSTQ